MGVQGAGMSIETGYADIAIDDFKAGMRQLAASDRDYCCPRWVKRWAYGNRHLFRLG